MDRFVAGLPSRVHTGLRRSAHASIKAHSARLASQQFPLHEEEEESQEGSKGPPGTPERAKGVVAQRGYPMGSGAAGAAVIGQMQSQNGLLANIGIFQHRLCDSCIPANPSATLLPGITHAHIFIVTNL